MIVLASGNRHKFEEIERALRSFPVRLLFGGDIFCMDVPETGTTYAENALQKAQAWADATGLPALADDSGLEVEALEGNPGIHSARVAENDKARIGWLLDRLEGVVNRRARFVAVLALAFPGSDRSMEFPGICPGRIALSPSGEAGFGYDPVFIPEGYDRTFAEMGRVVKEGISHRALAIQKFCRSLQDPSVVRYLLDCSRPEA